jgi:hypothetical protein
VRTQWIFRRGCGCAFGLLEGSCAAIEYDAWKHFYERVREIRAAQARGVTVERMSHERYVAEVYPQLRGDVPCRHASADVPS